MAITNTFAQPYPRKRCINYKAVEAKAYKQMTDELQEELGLTFSGLSKHLIRKEYQYRKNSDVLEMVQI